VIFIIFNKDVEKIVVNPIKKVVQIIIGLAESPLKKPEKPKEEEDSGVQMKTKMLEHTIFSIGTLLQRGFGDLGAQIVSKSLTQTDQGIDLTLPGKKVDVIFSICHIRQFIETTDCLQEEIIVFVNKIAKIVHEVGSRWEGKPTKNQGNKFVLTWRLPSFDDLQELEDEHRAKRLELAKQKAIEIGVDPDD
jgi:hypothetical protein